jgi:hypothetical protein
MKKLNWGNVLENNQAERTLRTKAFNWDLIRQPLFMHLTFRHTSFLCSSAHTPFHPSIHSPTCASTHSLVHPSNTFWGALIIQLWGGRWEMPWKIREHTHWYVDHNLRVKCKQRVHGRAGDMCTPPFTRYFCYKKGLSVFPHFCGFRKSCSGFIAQVPVTFSMTLFCSFLLEFTFPSRFDLCSAGLCSILFGVPYINLNLHYWLTTFLRSVW